MYNSDLLHFSQRQTILEVHLPTENVFQLSVLLHLKWTDDKLQ